MKLGITTGTDKLALLAAIAKGLDLDFLRLTLTPDVGILQITGDSTLRVQMTISRFETEGEGTALVPQDIGGYTLSQVITQLSNAVRHSITLIDVKPEEMQRIGCIGCLYVAYETENQDDWNEATFYLYITDVELVSL